LKLSNSKILTIIIYIVSIIAFFFIIIQLLSNDKTQIGAVQKIYDSDLENVINKIYYSIDYGNFDVLSSYALEGRWLPAGIQNNKKFYTLNGLVSKEDFINYAVKDYGENGWRLKFTSLEIKDINKIDKEKFLEDFLPEYEIIKFIKFDINKNPVYLANIKGFIVGSCSITDWEKKLPMLWVNTGWKVIVSGTPDDLRLIHRDQWFANINFKIIQSDG